MAGWFAAVWLCCAAAAASAQVSAGDWDPTKPPAPSGFASDLAVEAGLTDSAGLPLPDLARQLDRLLAEIHNKHPRLRGISSSADYSLCTLRLKPGATLDAAALAAFARKLKGEVERRSGEARVKFRHADSRKVARRLRRLRGVAAVESLDMPRASGREPDGVSLAKSHGGGFALVYRVCAESRGDFCGRWQVTTFDIGYDSGRRAFTGWRMRGTEERPGHVP